MEQFAQHAAIIVAIFMIVQAIKIQLAKKGSLIAGDIAFYLGLLFGIGAAIAVTILQGNGWNNFVLLLLIYTAVPTYLFIAGYRLKATTIPGLGKFFEAASNMREKQ